MRHDVTSALHNSDVAMEWSGGAAVVLHDVTQKPVRPQVCKLECDVINKQKININTCMRGGYTYSVDRNWPYFKPVDCRIKSDFCS